MVKLSQIRGKNALARQRRLMKKRANRRKALQIVNRALQPIPQRYICKMKYCESVNINIPSAGNVGTFRFNLNSIFDPNRTGTGHQPYGHDTFQTLYNRYRVISCSYAVSVFTTTNLTSEPIQLAAIPANEEVTIASGAEARESPRARYIVQAPTGAPIKTLRGKVYLPSLVGRNKAQYMADDRYQATYGTSPSELAILNLYTSLMNDGLVVSERTIQATVTLVYTVESFDYKQLAQS